MKNIKNITNILKLAIKYGAYIIVIVDVIKYAIERLEQVSEDYPIQETESKSIETNGDK